MWIFLASFIRRRHDQSDEVRKSSRVTGDFWLPVLISESENTATLSPRVLSFYCRVAHMDLLVIAAVHILTYQTWLKLSPSCESCPGVDIMYFSGSSSGRAGCVLLWWNYSRWTCLPQRHRGGTVMGLLGWGGECDSQECCRIWVIIEPWQIHTAQFRKFSLWPWICFRHENPLRCIARSKKRVEEMVKEKESYRREPP